MNPSVSLLMGFDCKCYLFTHEHFAGVNKVYYGRCAKGKLNKKYGRYLSVQKTNLTVVF